MSRGDGREDIYLFANLFSALGKTLLFIVSICSLVGCDKIPSAGREALICTGPKSATQIWVFAFETDSRTKCEVHSTTLFAAKVPTTPDPKFACVLSRAPHGRIIAYVPPRRLPSPDHVIINRCVECLRIAENYYGESVEQLQNYARTNAFGD
jgi:hypothetical protein